MKKRIHPLHAHLKKHHKKYLLGIFGSFAVVKAILLFAGFLGLSQLGHVFAAGELDSGNIVSVYGCATSATSCDFTWQGITSIATDTFVNHTALTTIDLRQNAIASLENGDFNGLTGLQYLWLGSNSITSLESGDFNGLGSALLRLDLQTNGIASIENGSFNGLSNLQYLYFMGCPITSLESGNFAGLSNLVYLNFYANMTLASIENGTFNGLTSLLYLDFESNALTSIESGDFNGLTNVDEIHLTNNDITSLESGDFNGLSNVTSLYINSNQITSLESGDFIGLGLSKLNLLEISNNAIASIENGTFNGMTNLKKLYIYSNQITSIDSGDFNGLSNLEELWLNSNQVTSVNSDSFNGLGRSKIKALALNGNLLTSIGIDTFSGMTNILSLGIAQNQLPTLPEDLTGRTSLTSLNPILNKICTGSLSPALITFVNNKYGDATWQDFQDTTNCYIGGGTFVINNDAVSTTSPSVTLNIAITGVQYMRFQNDGTGGSRSSRGAYATSTGWTLSTGYGTKTVYADLDTDGDYVGEASASDDILYTGAGGGGGGSGGCATGAYCGDLRFEVISGVSYCEYGTTLDFGQTGHSYSARSLSTGFVTTSGHTPWFCIDNQGLASRALTIQSSDILNITTNNSAHTIPATSVRVKNPDAYVASGSCTSSSGDSLNNRVDISGAKAILGKVGNAGEGCNILTDNVDLKVDLTGSQAVGQYSGTLTISLPSF